MSEWYDHAIPATSRDPDRMDSALEGAVMSGTAVDDPGAVHGAGRIRAIGRYRGAIMVTVVVAVLAAYFGSLLVPPRYTATATVVLAETDVFSDAPVDPERKARQEANRLTSRAVLARAADELGTDVTLDDLRGGVRVSADPGIGVLRVAATADAADAAAETANVVARSYEQVSQEATTDRLEDAQQVLEARSAELRSEIDELKEAVVADPNDTTAAARLETLQGQLVALETRSSEIAADAALLGSGVDEIERAVPPVAPSSPRPVRNVLAAGVAALAIAAAVAYWRAGVLAARPDPAAVLGAPLLAQIPDFGRSRTDAGGGPLLDIETAEAYQFLLASFEYAAAQHSARSILVTSATPGEGKSLTAIHLARALAIQGRDVILVDSDIRARGLTQMLKADQHPGLVALAEGAELDDVVRRYRISDAAQLPVIPAGQPPPQPTGLLATDRYREAIEKITATTELTIIDGGPLLAVADPSALAMQVSAILLVVDADIPEDRLLQLQQRLRLVSTPVIGYVLNRSREQRSDPDAYPYTYAADAERRGTRRRRRRAATPDAPSDPVGTDG